MSIQNDADRRGLEAAGAVVHRTLEALAAAVRPGVATAELDAVAAGIFAAHGARSAPALVYGFPGTVLISVNDEVVHGIPGPRRLRGGDVVKLDVTAERDGYMADAARTVVVEGGMNRPPYVESPAIVALYEKARSIASRVGLTLQKQHRGGGSDGNFTAAMGIPTLDGLGCPGAGAHAVHEHILWRQLEARAALMIGLLETLDQA